MAVTINAKGTSHPNYTIGKQGVTIYQGSTDPGAVNQGDVWFDTTDGSIKTYTNSAFSVPSLGTLSISGSTITPTGGTLNIAGALDATGNITAGTLILDNATNSLRKTNTGSYINISSSTTTATGGNIMLYGNTHSTLADDIKLRSGSTDVFHYDASADTITLSSTLATLATSGINDTSHVKITANNPRMYLIDQDSAIGNNTSGALEFQASDLTTYMKVGYRGSGNKDFGIQSTITGGNDIYLENNNGNITLKADGTASINNNTTIGATTIDSTGYIYRTSDTSSVTMSGGTSQNVGANIRLYGSSHATNPSDILFRDNTTDVMVYDNSAATWTFTGAVETATAPTGDNHLTNKAYVDSLISGLDVKASVRVTTTANITLSGTQTIDNVSVIAGDRVLVKNQTLGEENGIYVVASGAWARSSDADNTPSNEVSTGMYTFVSEGSANASLGFVLATNDTIVLGTTPLSFSQFSGAGQVTAGDGMSKSGSALSVDSTVVRTSGAQSIAGSKTYTSPTVFDNYTQLTTSGQAVSAYAYMQTDAGYSSNITMRTGSSRRWQISKNSNTESGLDTGSNFRISRYSDSDTLLGNAISIDRATGNVTLEADLTAGGTINIPNNAYTNVNNNFSAVQNINGGTANTILTLTSTDGNCNLVLEDGNTTGTNYVQVVGDELNLWTNSTKALNIDSSQNSSFLNGNVSIYSGDYTTSGALSIGADLGLNTRTNTTRKIGVITSPHYTNAEEDICVIRSDSDASSTKMYFGGGLSGLNAATQLNFHTGSTTTSLTGTTAMQIRSDQEVRVFGQMQTTGVYPSANLTHNLGGSTLAYNNIYGGHFNADSVAGSGIDFWNSANYSTYMADVGYIGRGTVTENGNGDFNIYFRNSGGSSTDGRGWVFYNDTKSATPTFEVTGIGDIYAGNDINTKNNIRINAASSFGTALSNGQGNIYAGSSLGLVIAGKGSVNDVQLLNRVGATALQIPTGTINVEMAGDLTVTGTVNSRDIAADGATLDSLSSTYLGIGATAANSNQLDGIDSTGFVFKSADFSGDLDTAKTNAHFRVNDTATNAPTATFYALNVYGNNSNVTSQLATHFQTGETYTRSYNTVWSSWRKQLDDTNFVAGTNYQTPQTTLAGYGITDANGGSYVDANGGSDFWNLQQHQMSSTDDLDTLTATGDQGFYAWSASNKPINAPNATNYCTMLITRENQNHQLAWGGSGTGNLWLRRANSGTYGTWTKFLNEANFTAGTDYVSISGTETISGTKTFSSNQIFADNKHLYLGNGADLDLFHNSTGYGVIRNNTGAFYIDNYETSGAIYLRTHDSSNATKTGISISGATPAVTLNYDGNTRVQTTNAGANITGSGLKDTSALAYMNIRDSVGVTLMQMGILNGNTTNTCYVQANDSDLYLNAKRSSAAAANVFIQADTSAGTGQTCFYAGGGGSSTYAQMRYANSTKIQTSSTGVTVTGVVNATSDISLKKNIVTYDPSTSAVSIRTVDFNWKDTTQDTDKVTGYIAQEVEKVMPEAVSTDNDGIKSVNYNAVHSAKIAELEAKVELQSAQIDSLMKIIDTLKSNN